MVGSADLPGRLERLRDRDRYASAVDLLLEVSPLRDRDIDRMVRHRLVAAGHPDGNLFSPVALAEVARRSRGEPMRIVSLCAAALALAEQDRKATVSRELVERAAERAGGDLEEPAQVAVVPAPTFTRTRYDETGFQDELHPPRPAEEPRGPVRRLDDVAEAIRAADRRSVGGADPHIRYSPAPSRPPVEREPHPSAEEHTLTAQPRGFSDEAYAVYPGIRPSETRAPRRRGIGILLAVGLVLALLAAGGAYALRTGMVDAGVLGGEIRALVDKVVHTVGSLVRTDPNADESVAGISPGTAGSRDVGTGDLGFNRFGSPPGGDPAATAKPYDFAPPPPNVGGKPAQRDADAAPPAPAGRSPSPGAAATPVAPPEPLPPLAAPDQGVASAQQPPPAAAAQPETGAAVGGAMASLRPPEMAKPVPPQPPAPATATARPLPPRGEEAQARPGREDAARPQHEPLLARGDEYLGSGDLDMARTFYQMAFERGSAEAAIRMGWTFDPQYFQRVGLRGEASPREAILWYQEALRRGSSQASGRLSDLATWLQSAAASGDLEAQRILRMWQG